MRETTRPTKDPAKAKLIGICDPHFAATSPPAFKADYLVNLENNLRQVLALAKREDVDAILWGGDLFHHREPKNNPTHLIARVIRLLAESALNGNLTHHGIAGNHDLRYGSLEAGLYGSPLDIVLASGQMTLLDHEETTLVLGDGLKIRLAGGSYHHGRAEHVRDKKKNGADRLVTLGHFWLGTQTGEFYGEPLFGHDFFAESESDVLIVGHHHEDKGIHLVRGKHFAAPGSITITGTHAHDLQRRPAATLIEITRDLTKLHVLRPKTPPASDLLDLEKHQQLKREREETDEFIRSLAETELTAPDPSDLLTQMAPPAEVRDRAQAYLEQAETRR